MKVIPPVEINDLTLQSVSVAEPFTASAWNSGSTYSYNQLVSLSGTIYQSLVDNNTNHSPDVSPVYWESVGLVEAVWASGTAYVINDIVIYMHRRFISLQNANTGNNPYTAATWWQDIGPTNQYAMFDTERDTATTASSPLTFTIVPAQRCNTIGFLDIVADSIEVVVTQLGVTVYDTVFPLLTRSGIVSGSTYFFTEFKTKKNLVAFDLPNISNGIISVTMLRSQGNVKLGACVVGSAFDLGVAQHDGLSDSMLNFSTITNDDFGNNVLVKRRSVSEPQITVWAPSAITENIIDLRETLNAEPALWCGIEDSDADFFRALCVLGVYTQFDIGLPYNSHSVLTLQLKEI